MMSVRGAKATIVLISLLLSLGAAGTMSAAPRAGQSRIDLGLGAGFGHSEIRGGLVDMVADIRFSLAPGLRLGLGVGYLVSSHGMNMHDRGGMMGGTSGGMMGGGMMGGTNGGMMGGLDQGVAGFRNRIQSVPLTVTAYYLRPLRRAWDVYLLGGGGYYTATFRDLSSQTKSAFGAHLGLGLDFKVARNIVLSAEALYRFVTVKNFRPELRAGYAFNDQGQMMEGFWSYDHMAGRFEFHMSDQGEEAIRSELRPFDLRLSGYALRVGLRLGL